MNPVVSGSPAAVAAVSPTLIAEVAARFGIGEHYARAYLEYWQRARGRTYDNLDAILQCEDPYPMWFEFAVSSNGRADQFRDFLQPLVGDLRGRYLDVGCGFGGYLRAFADRGMQVTGVEIDDDRVDLSRANARDGDLGDCVHKLDILAADALDRLGTFDLITCIDVIEHVLDVPLALRRMSDLLRPGGTLCLEIPNKDSIDFVGADGHFKLFGITQLDRPSAVDYHRRFFTFPYDVGDYHPAEYYVEQLAHLGVQASYATYPIHPARAMHETGQLLRGLAGRYRDYRAGARRKLPFALRAKVNGALVRYLAELGVNRARARREPAQSRFRARYLTNFWLLIARKPG